LKKYVKKKDEENSNLEKRVQDLENSNKNFQKENESLSSHINSLKKSVEENTQQTSQSEEFIIYKLSSFFRHLLFQSSNPPQSSTSNSNDSVKSQSSEIIPMDTTPKKNTICFYRMTSQFPNFENNLLNCLPKEDMNIYVGTPRSDCNIVYLVVFQAASRLNKPEQISEEIKSLLKTVPNVGLIILRLTSNNYECSISSNDFSYTSVLGKPFAVEFHLVDLEGNFTNPSQANNFGVKLMGDMFKKVNI